jgi:hypothetical protein
LQTKRLAASGDVAWHTHLLIRRWPRMNLEEIRGILVRHGLGERFNVKVRQVPKAGLDATGFAAYMTKTLGAYLTKGAKGEWAWAQSMEHLPSGSQLVTSSRSWAPGLTVLACGRLGYSKRGAVLSEAHRELGIPVTHTHLVEEVIRQVALLVALETAPGETGRDGPPVALSLW